MTVAGTGDGLAGLISGFSSQNNSLFDSSYAGTYLCGKIGDQLFKEFGNAKGLSLQSYIIFIFNFFFILII